MFLLVAANGRVNRKNTANYMPCFTYLIILYADNDVEIKKYILADRVLELLFTSIIWY